MSEGGLGVIDREVVSSRATPGDGTPADSPRPQEATGEISPIILAMPDEYRKRGKTILSPLREVRTNYGHDYTATIRAHLDHLSVTRDLEVDSLRVRQLQAYVDKMTKGTSIASTRVVIMDRGREPAAFTFPDGSIFLNQALINSLDTLDEVGGVLAHEVGHLINKTFENKMDDKLQFGVCWAHETAADLGAPALLEKADLNSTGFADAIQKISPNQRGSFHQGGDPRAAQNMGVHMGIHFGTSDKPMTPLPKDWKTPVVVPTNLEIVTDLLSNQTDKENLTTALSKLSIPDFAAIGENLNGIPHREAQHAVIRDRLQRASYSAAEINLFLISLPVSYGRPKILHSPEELVNLTNNLLLLETNGRINEMYRIIFDRDQVLSPTVKCAEYLAENLYLANNQFYYYAETGVEVTEATFIQALNDINNVTLSESLQKHKQKVIDKAIYTYLKKAYIDSRGLSDTAPDIEAMKNFIATLREKGIQMNEANYSLETTGNDYQLVREATGFSETDKSLETQIDEFFTELQRDSENGQLDNRRAILEDFFSGTLRHFIVWKMDDAQREPYIRSIIDRFGQFVDRSGTPLTEFLAGKAIKEDKENNVSLSDQEVAQNQAITRFTLQFLAASSLFSTDTEAFYQITTDIMNNSGIDLNALSSLQILNLCQPLLTQVGGGDHLRIRAYVFGFSKPRQEHFVDLTSINDIDRLMSLPFIREIVAKREQRPPITGIRELVHAANEISAVINPFYGRELSFFRWSRDIDQSIFSDSFADLIAFQDVRQAFPGILRQGVTTEDKEYLYEFIDKYLPLDLTTRRILGELSRDSSVSERSLSEKIDFLKTNFEKMGVEGLTLLGDQITTIQEFELLRRALGEKFDEYLKSNVSTDVVAGLDFVSSELTKHFERLFATTLDDSTSKAEASTLLGREWFDSVLPEEKFLRKKIILGYNSDTQTFSLTNEGKVIFRSITDIIQGLHDLSDSQRTALVMKALLDIDGAFASPEHRAKLGEFAVHALGLEEGFVASTLMEACRVADAKIVGLPLGRMFGPLLFRNLSVDSIDRDKVTIPGPDYVPGWPSDTRLQLPPDDLERVITSPTRDIVNFDEKYRKFQGSLLAELCVSSKNTFFDTMALLEETFPENKEGGRTEQLQLAGGIEGIIQGLQVSSAVGVRSLQLARQLMQFSPDIEQRLAQTFDSNPGLSKILFWENLRSFREKAAEDPARYGAVADFVSNRLVSLGDKLGGGSLYTTFAAVVREDDGQEKNAVIKMLNPNAALMIEKFYWLAFDTLEAVKAKGNPDEIREAEKALMLVDLAKQWCLADINDPRFEEDDDRFRQLVVGYNATVGKEALSVPNRLFTNYYIKSEMLASGRTLNAVLEDATLPIEQKREAARQIVDFFDFTVLHAPASGTRKGDFLLLSDPNPGNAMIDMIDGRMQVSILDRNLFLHLNGGEMHAIRNLWQGNQEAFFEGFVKSIFKENKVGGLVEPFRIGRELRALVEQEIIRAGGLNAIDPLSVLQVVMDDLQRRKLQVPLRMQLAIKNVFAMQELKRRYNL